MGKLPAVVMVHTDSRTGDMTALQFYSRDEAQDWLTEQVRGLE